MELVEGGSGDTGDDIEAGGVGRVSKRLMNIWDTEVNTATPCSPNSKIKMTST